MATWKTARIAPLEIALGRNNPRIHVGTIDKESDIIRKLIMYEDVQDLARKIAQTGLLPRERIIVVPETDQWPSLREIVGGRELSILVHFELLCAAKRCRMALMPRRR